MTPDDVSDDPVGRPSDPRVAVAVVEAGTLLYYIIYVIYIILYYLCYIILYYLYYIIFSPSSQQACYNILCILYYI